MAKTLATLTDAEFEIIREIQDLFDLSEEEALEQGLTDGSISASESNFKFKPEGFEELKLYIPNNKSPLYKANKALKKAKKDELFEDEEFYFGTSLPKDDKGDFILDECKTTALGEKPRIIVTKIAYKAKRGAFDGQGKALTTNFESTLGNSIFPSDQEQMVATSGDMKGQSAKKIIDALKKEYHDGKQGKTQGKVPDSLKVKWRVMLFGLVEIEGEWKKFYMDLANRYSEEEALTSVFDKEATGIKTRWLCDLEITSHDLNENPVAQIIPIEQMEKDEFKALAPTINETTREVLAFIEEQKNAVASSGSSEKDTSKESNEDSEEEEEDPFNNAE